MTLVKKVVTHRQRTPDLEEPIIKLKPISRLRCASHNTKAHVQTITKKQGSVTLPEM